jgi:YbgC/YbaW family acyl-CoA thioester hydrolase
MEELDERSVPHAVIRMRVPFVDVDSSGRIHYTAMFRYMEVAEHTLMRAIGLPYATTLTELAFPRVHLACDFRGAIRYDDVIDVEAWIERVGTSSWTVAFAARPVPTEGATEADGATTPPAAEGRMTIVAMDPATQRAVPLPARLRDALTNP